MMAALLSFEGFPALYLLMCCCSCVITAAEVQDGSYTDKECGRDINDERLARECLNVTNSKIKSPIVLESTIDGNVLCQRQTPLYSFSCTIYSGNLIWYFNNETVTQFLPGDRVGQAISNSYPESDPLYNITAVLAQAETVSIYNTTLCVSILTVQPLNFNEKDIEIIPFSISCQTFCKDDNRSAACQVKRYSVAAKPSKPMEVSGSIQNIPAKGLVAIASINWTPPENQNETVVDHYDITLIGSLVNNTLLLQIPNDTLPQTFSYNFGIPETNYSAVSVTAVDVCEQRGESSWSVLNHLTPPTRSMQSFSNTSDSKQTEICIGISVPLIIILFLSLLVTIVVSIGLGILYTNTKNSHAEVEGGAYRKK